MVEQFRLSTQEVCYWIREYFKTKQTGILMKTDRRKCTKKSLLAFFKTF
jgi:hypothetical protein